MKRIAFGFAASGLGLGMMTAVGIATAPASAQPNEGAHRQAGDLFQQAGRAIAENRIVDAVVLLEQAVTLAPRDAGYRLLLADAYMKTGRFQSAETTYGDVVSLDPQRARAGLGLALMQVANGRQQDAVAQLELLDGIAPAADLGLAWALAGVPRRAVDVLEPAARGANATARIRQNLALAYAFGGDWARARTIAAQDISPAEVGERMSQWATMAHRAGSPEPISALLGVAPAQDAGQPVRIALNTDPAPASQPAQFAEAQPVAPDAPVEVETAPSVSVAYADASAATAVETIPMPTDARVTETPAPTAIDYAAAEPLAIPAPAPAVVVAEPTDDVAEPETPEWGLGESGNVELPQEEPAAERVPVRVRYAAAAQELVRPDPVVMPVANRAVRAMAPVARRTFAGASLPGKRAANGQFVVQLGAFSSPANADQAWQIYQDRFGLRAEQPVTMTIDHRGRLLHRVAVSGFDKRSDATQACGAVKARGGVCFVRTAAGDASIDWAARYARNG